jgi:hypothetical protein
MKIIDTTVTSVETVRTTLRGYVVYLVLPDTLVHFDEVVSHNTGARSGAMLVGPASQPRMVQRRVGTGGSVERYTIELEAGSALFVREETYDGCVTKSCYLAIGPEHEAYETMKWYRRCNVAEAFARIGQLIEKEQADKAAGAVKVKLLAESMRTRSGKTGGRAHKRSAAMKRQAGVL